MCIRDRAYEGLSNAGEMGTNLIIVFHDNEMSIAEKHAGLYQNVKELRDTEGRSSCNFCRSLGLDYLYVGEGNDIPSLVAAFAKVKDTSRPTVVHICLLYTSLCIPQCPKDRIVSGNLFPSGGRRDGNRAWESPHYIYKV